MLHQVGVSFDLPHWSFLSWFALCWRLAAVRLEYCPGYSVDQVRRKAMIHFCFHEELEQIFYHFPKYHTKNMLVDFYGKIEDK